MPETTIKKVEANTSAGKMGQRYPVAGKRVSMRLWVQEPGRKLKAPTTREYETVGYVISGSARLDLEGQTLNLKAGRSRQRTFRREDDRIANRFSLGATGHRASRSRSGKSGISLEKK